MKEQLKERTKTFAIDIFRLANFLKVNSQLRAYINQLIRSSSSVGANYRAACRAKSTKDCIHKLKIVEEEIDESAFFLELLLEVQSNKKEEIRRLLNEAMS